MVDVVRFARTLLDALGADQSTELEQLLHGREWNAAGGRSVRSRSEKLEPAHMHILTCIALLERGCSTARLHGLQQRELSGGGGAAAAGKAAWRADWSTRPASCW